jgi:NADPH:quinone reductase-like Zn-dependent oxidoreductase
MQAVVRDRYGPPEILRLEEVPIPMAASDGVRVRVHASSVNQADLDYLTGKPWLTRVATGFRGPRQRGLGLDVSGVVDAVGPSVTRFRVGDAVFGDMTEFGLGAYAEYVAAPERAWAPLPVGLSHEDAATVPQGAILAIQALQAFGGMQRGDRVLVNGASGSVGPWAVQIAKAWGAAHVTGVASAEKLDLVRSLGADEVLDYRATDFAATGERWDRIVDVWASRGIGAVRRALTPRGRYLCIGGHLGLVFWIMAAGAPLALVSRQRMGLGRWRPFYAPDVETLSRLLASGQIRPVIDRTFPLADTPAALRYQLDRRALGKVVITVG